MAYICSTYNNMFTQGEFLGSSIPRVSIMIEMLTEIAAIITLLLVFQKMGGHLWEI